jgi:hypothetical protein
MIQNPTSVRLDVKVPPSKNSFRVQVRVRHSGGRHRRVHIRQRARPDSKRISVNANGQPSQTGLVSGLLDGSLNDAHHGDEDEDEDEGRGPR